MAIEGLSGRVVGTLDIVDGTASADLAADSEAKALLAAPGGVAYMENVAVEEGSRRRGVAAAMVSAALARAAAWRAPRPARVCAHVARSNTAAAELYRKAGFAPADAERSWAGRSDASDAARYDPYERLLLVRAVDDTLEGARAEEGATLTER